MALQEFQNKYPFLKKIPVYERNKRSFDYYKSIYDKVCKSFIEKNGDIDISTDMCMELVANLHDFSLNTRKNTYNYCLHFIYWLYNKEIFSKFSSKHIDELYDDLISTYNHSIKKPECNYDQLNMNDVSTENIMKLLNFSDNINDIVKIMKNPKDGNFETCCQYVKDNFNLYKNTLSSKCSNIIGNSTFCTTLGIFNMNYEVLRGHLSTVKINIPSLNESSPTEFSCSHIPEETGGHLKKGIKFLRDVADRVGLRSGEVTNYIGAFSSTISGDSMGSNSPIQTYVRRAIDNSGIFDTSNPIANEVINTFFTIIPFFFLLYRYTPIGTWIRIRILRKITMCICRRFRSKHPCFTRIFNIGQRIFRLKRYNVGYQALKNF
ncbi:PIR protein [Plasmodium ovale]|uniref:PIR protein n=1 Tax=Plasmodium ovale TaxID=36330 RepID=A0A1C3KJQ9_PLAOA|nr:PIR protein [Plasmodium ovale]